MPLRIQPDLGNFPGSEDAVKGYLAREVHPVLKATRRTVNEVVDVTPHPWIDDTTDANGKVVATIEINEDELVSVDIKAKGSAGAGDWVFVHQVKHFERSGGAIALILTEVEEEPIYAGDNSTLTTASAGVSLSPENDEIQVIATGESGTPIHWTVEVQKTIALRRTEKT